VWLDEMTDYHGAMKEKRWILGHVIDHEIHHRGQMTVLLRLKDASVPMVYGPTADECNEVPRFRRHLFVCTGPRCTVNGQSEALFKVMARKLKDYSLDQGMNAVRQTRCNCFLVCSGGPIVVVYPDNVWYRKVTPELLDRIITEHLKNGTPVQEHVYYQG
jgi:(2Fe-2S) ferredoxin